MRGRTIAVDFDGTVTEMDLLDTIARDFGDPVVYQEVDDGLDGGTMPLREVITREFEPVKAPLEEVVQWELDNVRVRDGLLRGAVRLVPRRRAAVELHDDAGLAPLQLGAEAVAKLALVPVRLAPPIERHEEEVRTRE